MRAADLRDLTPEEMAAKLKELNEELFKLNFGDVYTIGIGDSLNDIEMLSAVDSSILVQTLDNRWNRLKVKHLKRVTGIGPEGWAKAASELFSQK